MGEMLYNSGTVVTVHFVRLTVRLVRHVSNTIKRCRLRFRYHVRSARNDGFQRQPAKRVQNAWYDFRNLVNLE